MIAIDQFLVLLLQPGHSACQFDIGIVEYRFEMQVRRKRLIDNTLHEISNLHLIDRRQRTSFDCNHETSTKFVAEFFNILKV